MDKHILTTQTILLRKWRLIALLLVLIVGCNIFSSGSSGENRREWSEPMVLFVDPDTVDSGPLDGIGTFKMEVHEGTIRAVMDRGRFINDSLLDFKEIILLEMEPGSEPQFRQLTPIDIPSQRPIILRDQAGSLHLMWADRRLDPDFEQWEFSSLQTLFSTNVVYSRYNGSSFESPVSIYEGNLSTFGRGDIAFPLHLIEAEDRRLHAVFKADSAWRTTTLLEGDSITVFTSQVTYMNRNPAGQWSKPRFLSGDSQQPGVQSRHTPAIAAPSANRLVVGFLSSAGGNNDVFTITSDDGGRTWSDQQLVFSSGQQPSSMLRMMQAQGGQTHLIWGRAHRGLPLPGEMWHSYSEDGGITWSTPEQFFKLESEPTLTGPDRPPGPIFLYIGSFDLLVDERDHLGGNGAQELFG